MKFDEQDIDFLQISDKEFEELCFDLLLRLGYKGLVWRQGGADSGRDIEGRLSVNNSLVDTYEEKLGFCDIISEYFLDNYTKLLIDSRKTWLIHDLLPDLETLSMLIRNIDESKLSIDELAFLWCSAKIRTSEIDEWPDRCEPFCTDDFGKQRLGIKRFTLSHYC